MNKSKIQPERDLRIGFCLHAVKGSPIYPGIHVQLGTWFLTSHWALIPQVPGQGSTHLFRWQALFDGQSELTTHSGRQATYGSPKVSGLHWQAAARLRSVQKALVPQGEGLQGSITSVGAGTKIKNFLKTLQKKTKSFIEWN